MGISEIRWRILIACVAVWFAQGCVHIGEPFPVQNVQELRIGETTREDVLRAFGDPWRTGIEDGQRTFTYAQYRYSLFGEVETRDLLLRFDADGTLSSYAFNSTHPEDGSHGRSRALD